MRPPKFWHNDPQKQGIWPIFLMPFSYVWQAASTYRWKRGVNKKVGMPVICVGNVNLGGTGKTPSVIAIAMRLIEMGHRPHIVSKGYKGKLQGPAQVDPKMHSADDVGDEPLLLAAFAPTWVAKNRIAGAEAAKSAGADVVILDDGMQNPSLAKNLTIMVVDAKVGFGNGLVFPAGPLREPLKDAVKKADIALSVGLENSHQELFDKWPILASIDHIASSIIPLKTGMDWDGLPVLAFAGIGRPEKFFDTLRSLGANIQATRSFDDHQTISNTLLTRLENEAKALGAQLVTTEKDAVRLPKEWQQKVLTVPVRLEVLQIEKLDAALKSIF